MPCNRTIHFISDWTS